MIVNKNIHPERDLYYLGGKVIEILQVTEPKSIDFFELYLSVNKNTSITMNLFTLVLDWLFIIKVIKKGSNGEIEKCF